MLRLTLVTPTYNQAEYLPECIDSILPQIESDCVYIVVNDGSTDDTPQVLNRYRNDPRLKIISQENCGQVKTLNNIWSASDAKYLGYLSSDDLLIPGALDLLLNFLDQNPNVVAVYPDFYQINREGEIISSAVNGDFDQRLMFERLICQPGPCTIFRRSAFLAAGGWRADLRITPDLEFWSRISVIGKIARYPEYLAKYRVHEESQSTGVMPYARANEILKIPKIFSKTLFDSSLNYSYVTAVGSSFVLAGLNHYKGGRLYIAVGFLSIGYGIRALSALASNVCSFFKKKEM